MPHLIVGIPVRPSNIADLEDHLLLPVRYDQIVRTGAFPPTAGRRMALFYLPHALGVSPAERIDEAFYSGKLVDQLAEGLGCDGHHHVGARDTNLDPLEFRAEVPHRARGGCRFLLDASSDSVVSGGQIPAVLRKPGSFRHRLD